jgi:hypothetical protein
MADQRATAWWFVAVVSATFLVYAASPVRQNYDSYLAFPTAQSIVHERDVGLGEFDDPALSANGVADLTAEGERINYFPWLPSVALVPAVVAIDLAHLLGIGPGSFAVANGGRMDLIQQLTASMLVALVAGVVFLTVFERLRRRLPLRSRRAVSVTVALGFAFGTSAWSTASRAVWQHGPSMLCLAIALFCAQRVMLDQARADTSRWLVAVFGASVAASYACRPTNVIAVLGFGLLAGLALRHSWRSFVVGAIAIWIPWAVVNLAAFGSVLQPYYTAGRTGWHAHYVEALGANLVSPARGLLVFSPIVLLSIGGVTRKVRGAVAEGLLPLDRTLVLMALGYLLVSSGLKENWWAGHSFGPRFSSETLVLLAPVASCVVAATLDRGGELSIATRRTIGAVAVALLSWSVFVNAQGGLMRATLCWNGSPNIDTHVERVWDLADPQFLAGIQVLQRDGVSKAIFTSCEAT